MTDQTNLTDEERCTVRNPKAIGQIMAELIKEKAMINVSFNQGQDQCLTSIIAVDRIKNIAYLDIGIDEGFNKRLLASNHIVFTKDEGVKVKWVSTGVAAARLQDGEAIKIALPPSLVRLQRREFFRLKTPIVNPVQCCIPVADPENPEEKIEIELTLLDVSLGGIGAITADPLHPGFIDGARFDGCKIKLPDIGETNLTLCVRNVREITLRDRSIKYRVGFEFIEPSRGNQGLIQRYVSRLEREAIVVAQRNS
jgi:flagellar brake protein